MLVDDMRDIKSVFLYNCVVIIFRLYCVYLSIFFLMSVLFYVFDENKVLF